MFWALGFNFLHSARLVIIPPPGFYLYKLLNSYGCVVCLLFWFMTIYIALMSFGGVLEVEKINTCGQYITFNWRPRFNF